MDIAEFVRESNEIWEKAEAHLRKMFELCGKDNEGVLRPLDFPGFGEAVVGLLQSLVGLFEDMKFLEERANRLPQIRLSSFRDFLRVLKGRLK